MIRYMIYDKMYDFDVLKLEKGERHNIPESWMLINNMPMFWFGIVANQVGIIKIF